MAIFASAGLASLCILLLCIIFIIASRSMKFAIFFYQYFILFVMTFFIVFVVLTVMFFLLIIRNNLIYLEEITTTLGTISDGNLDIHIPVKTRDEFGKMAQTVNMMARKLKSAIEEERRVEKSKNDLITNIAHDLRTPLTSTLGYLELINDMKLNESNISEYINIAHVKCKDLKVLIDNLFEYSKLHNTKMKLNKTMVSLGELIEQVIIGFIPVLKEAGMEYRLFFTDEKLISYADPILLTRVFDNLINNAINYGREGKYLDIKLKKENDVGVIQVINYGSTIPDDDLPYVFDRFYRGTRRNPAKRNSSGLGLAIVKLIIDMHEGKIEVKSNNDRTVFEVMLKLE